MIDFTIETTIARSPADVFAYATDPAKLSAWQTNTVSAIPDGDGPIGLGTRLREVHRGPGGREFESVVEVSEFEPERVFALEVVEGLPIHGRITFTPDGEGTAMAFRVHGQPTGIARFAQPLLRRQLRKQFAEDCATLKRVLEST